ncbi:MAG TPA: ChbG/HpnK family deacetylase [Geoalkalibacter subterraneus]|uniref:ChbG/HpnK family deacetylase n=1 Tax=Geoalkalibacter subterraneus TaxID=483547 RepID=A0A831PMT1_9BACT|nr:ChbG/HpnK family deacetylase [Geoalkalibacter subterraneus]
MIRLIVSADDLGANPARNRGILEAFTHGIVTSASLLANGEAFFEAVELAGGAQLPVGVHLNLSEGLSLTGNIPGLTDQQGRFRGKEGLRDCLKRGACPVDAVKAEWMAQIERVFASGLIPDHLDSHQHCHLFPPLSTLVLALAQRFRIGAVRCSRPAEPVADDPCGGIGEELRLYRRLSRCREPGQIKMPDGLWGMTLLNRLNRDLLCGVLERLPAGTWELMTHPGYPCRGGSPFDGEARQEELQALTSVEARAAVERRGIQLCSYRGL